MLLVIKYDNNKIVIEVNVPNKIKVKLLIFNKKLKLTLGNIDIMVGPKQIGKTAINIKK